MWKFPFVQSISRTWHFKSFRIIRIHHRAKCSTQIRGDDRPGEQGKYTMEITFVRSDFIRQALARIQSNFVPVVITPVVQHRESPRRACMYASSYVKWKRTGSWSRTALCHTCTVRIRIRYGSHMGRCVPEPGLIIFLHTSTGNFCRELAKNFEHDKPLLDNRFICKSSSTILTSRVLYLFLDDLGNFIHFVLFEYVYLFEENYFTAINGYS